MEINRFWIGLHGEHALASSRMVFPANGLVEAKRCQRQPER